MRRTRTRIIAAAAGLLGLVAGGGGAALAQAAAGDPLKTREEFMKRYGALAREMRGTVGDAATLPAVATAADEIATKSAEIPNLFRDGTQGGDALPAVWTNRADFENQSRRMGELAQAVAASARTGDQPGTLRAYGAMGQQGCGGCHELYRVKRDN